MTTEQAKQIALYEHLIAKLKLANPDSLLASQIEKEINGFKQALKRERKESET